MVEVLAAGFPSVFRILQGLLICDYDRLLVGPPDPVEEPLGIKGVLVVIYHDTFVIFGDQIRQILVCLGA